MRAAIKATDYKLAWDKATGVDFPNDIHAPQGGNFREAWQPYQNNSNQRRGTVVYFKRDFSLAERINKIAREDTRGCDGRGAARGIHEATPEVYRRPSCTG